jgi:iron(III) transport system substrate-binding protein
MIKKDISFIYIYKLLSIFLICIIALNSVSAEEVNVYSARKGYLLEPLIQAFEKDTGIRVNIISGKAKALQKRIEQEGYNSKADILLTVDAGNLNRAKEANLLKKINSMKVTVRELSTYEDLANEKWKGRICIRSSSNIYNQSLLASMIAHNGEDEAESWAKKVVDNFSRKPKGNDRSQMTAVVLNECDITLANTYYLGKWITSDKNTEREYSDKIAVFFPNQKGRGAHINISGAAVIKTSKNTSSAIKFIEFLAGDKAQKLYSQTNHEYPIRDNIQVSKIVESWGYPFKKDKLSLNKLGMFNKKAVIIFDKVGWK